MKMVTELNAITELFARTQQRFLAFKGPILSNLVHNGDSYRRSFGDLDLMVDPAEFDATFHQLKERGYNLSFPNFKSLAQRRAFIRFSKAQNFYAPELGCTIDLHWRLLSQWIAFDIPFEELWRHHQVVKLANGVEIPTFSNEHQILFLAFHGSQDGWPRLKQLLDLTLALNNLKFDAREVYRRVGNRRPLFDRAVSLSVDLLGGVAPVGHRPFFKSEAHALRFLKHSMTLPAPPQLALLGPGLWERPNLYAIKECLRAILTPSTEDIKSVNLPHWAIDTYILIRFFRLVKKLISGHPIK